MAEHNPSLVGDEKRMFPVLNSLYGKRSAKSHRPP